MERTRAWTCLSAALLVAVGLGAAPAPPSYVGVASRINEIQKDWRTAGYSESDNPYGGGWEQFFGSVSQELDRYCRSNSIDERVQALNRLYQDMQAMSNVTWPRAVTIREELRAWLRPRIALAWAEYRVLEGISAIPADQQANRDKWESFIETDLRPALHEFEAAETVVGRLDAHQRVQAILDALAQSNQVKPWSKSYSLQQAVADLYNVPNLEVTVDRSSVTRAVAKTGLVEPGPIFFKGQWSYVTPGPITGVGFVPTNDGIQVSVSQALTSVTPVQGFNQQVAQDPQGQRATKLYHFDATTQNNATLTITVLFRLATGIQLAPSYQHGISAAISSQPTQGNGLMRGIASLIGMNQNKITDKVYEGAIGKIRQEVAQSAMELAGIKASQKASTYNSQLLQYVVDPRTIASKGYGVTDLRFQTQPNYALIQGMVVNLDAPERRGGTLPQPWSLSSPSNEGVTIDVHLPSAASNIAKGFMQGSAARDVQNFMIVTTKNVDNPTVPGVYTERNVDFPTYLAKVKETREGDGRSTAIRVYKPEKPIEAAADAEGHLVLVVPDFTIDVPAPPQATKGGALTGPPAQVYRIKAQRAEFIIDVTIQPPVENSPARIAGKVVGFDGGPNIQVLAINEDEAQAVALNAITGRIIATAFGTQLSASQSTSPSSSSPTLRWSWSIRRRWTRRGGCGWCSGPGNNVRTIRRSKSRPFPNGTAGVFRSGAGRWFAKFDLLLWS